MLAVFLMLFSLMGLILSAPFSSSFTQMSDQQYFEWMRKIQPESPRVDRKPAIEVPVAENQK